ncbi:hypothetical protein [Psychrilyobacter sp.]|uniref:hypothetical protein n=1 Tax=Psychrilyobacter sp. TaxID=2586924 RepID=UPI00301A581E
MANIRLVKPNKDYENSFLTYVKEIKKSGSETYELCDMLPHLAYENRLRRGLLGK